MTLVQSLVTAAIFILLWLYVKNLETALQKRSGFLSFLTSFLDETLFFFLSCYYTQHSKMFRMKYARGEKELFSGETKLEQGSLQTLG